MTDNLIHASDLYGINNSNNPDDNEEEEVFCTICQENIDMQKEIFQPTSWALETCGHRYHIGCIINWFRQGNSSCPLCGDNGISIQQNSYRNGYYGAYGSRVLMARFAELRKYSRKSNAPKSLKTAMNKIKQFFWRK